MHDIDSTNIPFYQFMKVVRESEFKKNQGKNDKKKGREYTEKAHSII